MAGRARMAPRPVFGRRGRANEMSGMGDACVVAVRFKPINGFKAPLQRADPISWMVFCQVQHELPIKLLRRAPNAILTAI